MRRGHPLAYAEAVTAARYAEAEHITISRRGRFDNALDEALARLGLTRRVVATAPTEGAGLEFVRESDLLVTAPESTTRSAAADLGLILVPLPFELPSAPVYLSWHQRYDTDPAHVWLRELARTALAGPTRGRN
jgi:DNA-binding transcriptional LysR family regulator